MLEMVVGWGTQLARSIDDDVNADDEDVNNDVVVFRLFALVVVTNE